MGTANGYSVELKGVRKRFSAVAAVHDVDLAIRKGEFFALLGPSGCGKTTLLRIIAGFEAPDAGEIRIAGRDVSGIPPNERPVNLVFQHYALFPHLTVFDNVAFGLRMRGLGREEVSSRAAEGLETVQLSAMSGRYPHQLSGGQQQRVALARALVNRPELLLLDEPMAALDEKLRKSMREELKELQHRVGISFLYVTHDQEEALEMADRIGVMEGGRLLQAASPQEIYEAPASRFVADFVGASNLLPGRVCEAEQFLAPSANGGKRRVVVDIPGLGRLAAYAQGAVSPGASVLLVLRPERIHLSAEREEALDNRLEAKVEKALFLGSDILYHARLGDGRPIHIRALHSPLRGVRRAGERVLLQWRSSDAWLLPA